MRRLGMLPVIAMATVACGSASSTPNAGEPVVHETSAGVIETPEHGPQIAFSILESYPPQGGDVPLANWDWATAPKSETADGTTWGGSYRLIGTWDGTAFTLTKPPESTTEPPFQREYGRPTDECDLADIESVLNFTAELDRSALGIIGSGEDVWDGRCGGYVEAMFDTPELRAALEPIADRTITFFYFREVGSEPQAPLPTLEPIEAPVVGPTTSTTAPR